MDLGAQGVTTAAIEGNVRYESSDAADGALVRVVNRGTGYTLETVVRGGRFLLHGLEIGGPYSVYVRHLGYRQEVRDGLFLTLGQRLTLDFALVPIVSSLDTIRVVRGAHAALSRAAPGIGATISGTMLQRLPTRNRDLYDFVQLIPQVSARSGISGGGVNPRLNSFLLDGVSERALQGNNAAGAASGGKAISIEAVKEYQVLLSPYDARYGDFAGALVNAVTRSGTNEVRGTGFIYARNEKLARNTAFLRSAPYERTQFGFAVGGPIVRDRAHFFLAPEFQRLTAPAIGPYIGQSASSAIPVPVSAADAGRFSDILESYRLEAGSPGAVEVGNPLVNVFGRIDGLIPGWQSRLVLRYNYGRVQDIRFSRDSSAVFPMSSYGLTQTLTKHATAVQLYTTLPSGGMNELTIGYTSTPSIWTPNVRQPVLLVSVPRSTGAGSAFLRAGSNENAHGISLQQASFEIADNLTVAFGASHQVALGARAEFFRIRRGGVIGAYGSWSFSSLDSLAREEAESFRLVKDLGGAAAPLAGVQYALYANDEWQLRDNVSLTFGLRADVVALGDPPPYNATIDTVIGRNTSVVPPARVHWSPRLGFSWDMNGDGRSQLRGGTGIFVGRPPLGWLHGAIYNYGSGIVTLSCGTRPTDAGRAPRFVADYRDQPNACANGSSVSSAPVNLLAKNLRLAETLRASLAYDRLLPWNVVATVEGLYTRNLSDFLFVNLNLAGPRGVDRNGRVMYGTVNPAGRATPAPVSTSFSDVIDLRNQSSNHALQLSGRLEKRFSDRIAAMASYAHSRSRDVQTPLSGFQANANWQTGRVLSGSHDQIASGISSLDLPHRVVLTGIFTAPWQRWATDFAVYYVGESGSPFTYLASAGPGRGDLNADGTNANDPIYVPRNALDASEILFAGTPADIAAQQTAFERLIGRTACLRKQRGRILERNSCRAPAVHVTNASVRQSLPTVGRHALTLQLEIFNVLNLLNKEWGHLQVPNASLLEQVAQTPGVPPQSQPVFRFDAMRRRFDSQNIESSYQIQLALRYSF